MTRKIAGYSTKPFIMVLLDSNSLRFIRAAFLLSCRDFVNCFMHLNAYPDFVDIFLPERSLLISSAISSLENFAYMGLGDLFPGLGGLLCALTMS